MIGQQVLSYRILRQLGAGGMGVVYEAEDTRLGRHVALKFLPASFDEIPDATARFEREARILSSLNHPNICTIHDIGAFADAGRERRFIVMELLEGESLRARMHGQPLPIDLVVDIGSQIADALDAAHDKGVVHRDIKPANIFLTKRGPAKLLDFGVAKPGGEAGGTDEETRAMADQLTVPGMTVGSINYMSPEQARGQAIDRRTDLFSLGIVLYEMATGKQPFAGPTPAVVYDAILNQPPAPVCPQNADAPPDLERIILRALEKDARLRYQTAGDLAADLRRLRRDTGAATVASHAAPASGPAPAAVTASVAALPRRRPRWALVGVPVLLLLGVAGFWLWHATKAPAFTERDVILVADFTNSTNDPVFDDALKQAVSVQLQQTAFVTLLPEREVQTTLALMQKKADERVIGAVARELCQRAGAKATVEGSIAPLGSSYVIALGVHDCQSGAAIAEEQTQADTKEGVLKAVGGAVSALRKRLGESLASIQKNDLPAAATTSSLEALRAYGLGLKARVTTSDEASVPLFEQAIQKDPDFALAHARLSTVLSNLGRAAEAKPHAQKAYDLRDKVSEYERLYIMWSYFGRVEQNIEKQKEALDVLVATYPRDFAAKNNLGIYYRSQSKNDDALAQFLAAHEIAPSEPQPVINAMNTFFDLGREDEGMKMAEVAMTLRPGRDAATTRWVHGHLRHDAGEAAYRDAAVKYATPENVLQIDAAIAVWDGRASDYAATERKLIEFYRADKRESAQASANWNFQITQAVWTGGRALESLKASLAAPNTPRAVVGQAAVSLAMAGDSSVLQREMPRFERDSAAAKDAQVTSGLLLARAYWQSANGRTDDAVATLQGVIGSDARQAGTYFNLAQVQERGGRTDEAIASYRRVVDAAPALALNPTVAIARLALGRMLAATGDAAGARAQFDILAAQWAHADADFGPAMELHRLAR